MKKLKFDASKIHRIVNIAKKFDTPSAHSAYAIIGVIGTTILAIAATRKQCIYELNKVKEMEYQKSTGIERTEKEKTELVTDALKTTAKNYIPVAASALATIYEITKSNRKWMACNNLINLAFVQARDKMGRYRRLASSVVAAELVKGIDGQKSSTGLEWFCLKDIPSGVYCEAGEHRDIYFQSTKADVIEAEYNLNRNFQLRGSASVRELCAFLGIVDQFPEELGDTYGWHSEEMWEWGLVPWIDMEHCHTTDPETGEVINAIFFTWEPEFSPDFSPLAYGYGDGDGFPYKGMFPTE